MLDEISILLSADENYARQCAITMLSVLSNTAAPEKVRFYLLTPDLTGNSRDRLEAICRKFTATLSVFFISLKKFESFPLLHEHFSLSTYSRLLGPDLCVDCDRLVYLDCDLVVLGDISDLFYMDLSGMPLGAVPHVSLPYQSVFTSTFSVSNKDRYFNAGAMVIDANYWRKNKVTEAILQLAIAYADKLEFADQDPLNVFFWENYAHLPGIWNVEARLYSEKLLGVSQDEETSTRMKLPQLIHYTGADKPWKSERYVAKRRCYLEYSDRLTSLLGWESKSQPSNVNVKGFWHFVYACLYFRAATFRKFVLAS